VPVAGGFVVLGERARVPVRRMVEDGRGGYQPVVVPPELAQAAGVPVNGQGEVPEEETVVLGHTYLQREARADNRNWLAAGPIGKFNVLSALMAQGRLSPEQVREEVVPEEMREEDDEKRAAAAEAAAQKQAEMMEQLATALNAKVVEGAAALGTTPQAFRSLQAVFLPELLQKTLSEMEAMTSAS